MFPLKSIFSYRSFSCQQQFKTCCFWVLNRFLHQFTSTLSSKHHLYANSIHLKNNHNKQTQSPKHFAFIYTSLSKHSPLICKHHHSNVFSCFIHIIIPNIVQNNTHLKANSIIQTQFFHDAEYTVRMRDNYTVIFQNVIFIVRSGGVEGV